MTITTTPDSPARAAELIARLGLTPHPEGGYFRETHRSPDAVVPADGRAHRSALTTIHFLLTSADVSRWHRVASDEAWYFLEGAPLELHTAPSNFDRVESHVLGPLGASSAPTFVVRAGDWQAARSTGAYTLVGCAVGPGFEYADFELLRDVAGGVESLQQKAKSWERFA